MNLAGLVVWPGEFGQIGREPLELGELPPDRPEQRCGPAGDVLDYVPIGAIALNVGQAEGIVRPRTVRYGSQVAAEPEDRPTVVR